ncbi:MAG: helix-turn-helix transcriptional regulator [Oligoflexia bacterium]|nr:helix-turn-helix transcriptional regulator [Oligoflexia bacterium]
MNREFLKTLMRDRGYSSASALARDINLTTSTFERIIKGTREFKDEEYLRFAKAINLSEQEAKTLYNQTDPQFSLKTSSNHKCLDKVLKDLEDESVSKKINLIGSSFLAGIDFNSRVDEKLINLSRSVSKVYLENQKLVVKLIRKIIGISETKPLTIEDLTSFFAWSKINLRSLPFESLEINKDSDGTPIRGFSVEKDQKVLICYDIGRAYHSIVFTIVHEFTHIVTGTVGKKDRPTEDAINAITSELIYPREYLKKFIPDVFDPIKNVTLNTLDHKRLKVMLDTNKSMSPRGLARALRKLVGLNPRGKVYQYLYEELHNKDNFNLVYNDLDFFRIDYSNWYEFSEFMKRLLSKKTDVGVIFKELINNANNGKVPYGDVGKIFGLDRGEMQEIIPELRPLLS